jgi:D-aminopeptidase
VLCQQGRGATFGGIVLPVAVQAILFDLMNGGEKGLDRGAGREAAALLDLGRDAAMAAAEDFALGTVGAGYGWHDRRT